MHTIRHEIASALEAYLDARDRGDVAACVAAGARLYEAVGHPLGRGLGWVWLQFETWTTTN